MAPDPADKLFLYHRGQAVRWAAYPDIPHYVAARRYEERTILGPAQEYRLRVEPTDLNGAVFGWVSEADLQPWEAP